MTTTELKAQGWTLCSERLPTEKDGNEDGYINMCWNDGYYDWISIREIPHDEMVAWRKIEPITEE